MRRIGWLTFPDPHARTDLSRADTYIQMRFGSLTRALAEISGDSHELYSEDERYDAVVFLKLAFGEYDEREALFFRLKESGVRVIFDVNVNYYEISGEFPAPGLKPMPRHMRHALLLTQAADAVVADSTYIESLARRHSSRVFWVPDNVDMQHFRFQKRHGQASGLVLGWCGQAAKYHHLRIVLPVLKRLADLPGLRLRVISNAPPDFDLPLPWEFVPYDFSSFPADILPCDVSISPKLLNNSYEMGHSEYKISTFMAQGIPVVASPQPSYLDAVEHGVNGFIASSDDEWLACLRELAADHALRAAMGAAAAETVRQRYSSEAVAQRYNQVFQAVFQGAAHD